MVRKLLLSGLLTLLPIFSLGQSSYSGTQDFSGATVRLPNGTSDPAACTVADIFVNTTTGAVPKICTAINTWGLFGIGGSTGSTDNAILRADGTGGATLQASNCTVSDAGDIACAVDSATTNAGVTLATLTATTTGTGAAGFGPQIDLYTENASGGTELAGRIAAVSVTATDSFAGYSAIDISGSRYDGNVYRYLRMAPLGTSFPTSYPGTGPTIGYVSDAGVGLVGLGLVSSNNLGYVGLGNFDAVGTLYFGSGLSTDASGQQANNAPGLRLTIDGRNGTTADYVTLSTNPRNAATNAIAPDLNIGAGLPESFTDAAGSDTVLFGGQGRGAGTPGAIIFQTSATTTSGTTAQTLVERGRFDTDGSFEIRSTGSGTPVIFEVTANSGTGADNTLVGKTAGDSLTTGYRNTFIGNLAGTGTTTGALNTAIGDGAGGAVAALGSGNVAVGVNALYNGGATDNAVCVGYAACSINSNVPDGTIMVGYGAGATLGTTTALNNLGIGYQAFRPSVSADYDYNIAIGDNAGAEDGEVDDCLAVGRSSKCDGGSNTINLGSTTAPYTADYVTRSATGSQDIQALNSEQITLSTGGTTTNSSGNIVPANSIVDAIACRVTTTITTATDWVVSVTGGNAFNIIGSGAGASTSLTAGNTVIWVPNAHADQYNGAATTITITTTGTPGAGAIRCAVHSRTFTPPTS